MLSYPYLHDTGAQSELEHVIQRLESCSLSQIFALRRTLNSYTEVEIEWEYHKHRDRRRSATSSLWSQPVWDNRSSYAPSFTTNRTSYASSSNSCLSATSNKAGTPSFGGTMMAYPDLGEAYADYLHGSHGGDGSQQYQQNGLPALEFPPDTSNAGLVPQNIYHAHLQERQHFDQNASPQGPTRHPSTTVKPFIPCPDPTCPAMYTKLFELTKHIKSCHARDRAFICHHHGCGNTVYVESEAKRHHKIHHKECSNDPVNCIDSHILHVKKVWGCGVCLHTELSENAWVEHYSSHFSNQELSKNDVNFSQTVRSLLHQDSTRSIWNKTIEAYAPYLKHSWREDKPGVKDLVFGLEYGDYNGGKLENDPGVCGAIVDAAVRLADFSA